MFLCCQIHHVGTSLTLIGSGILVEIGLAVCLFSKHLCSSSFCVRRCLWYCKIFDHQQRILNIEKNLCPWQRDEMYRYSCVHSSILNSRSHYLYLKNTYRALPGISAKNKTKTKSKFSFSHNCNKYFFTEICWNINFTAYTYM